MPPAGRRGGKFSKPTRGGGKHFSRDLQPLDKDGNPIGMWREPGDKKGANDSSSEESSSEEESTEESDDNVAGPATTAGGQDLSREARKEEARKKKLAAIAKKNRKVAEPGDLPTSSSEDEEAAGGEDGLPANPNHSSKARMQARVVAGPSGETPLPKSKEKDNLSRREREAIEKEAARERYQKLHAEGKTDEAKADLARLRLIRQQREEAAARKKAEQEERDEEQQKRQTEIDEREKKLKAAAMGDTVAKTGKKTRGKK